MTESNVIQLCFIDQVLCETDSSPLSQSGVVILPNASGVLIHVQAGSQGQRVQLQHKYTTKNTTTEDSELKVKIRLESGSALELAESHVAEQDNVISRNIATDLDLSENSSLIYDESQLCSLRKITRARLARGATLNHVQLSLGGQDHKSNLEVLLDGENATANFNLLFAVRQGHTSIHDVLLHHAVPHATSQQIIKGIVQEGGRARFHGHVCVDQGAQKTIASQVNKNLLLGPKAFVDTQPTLEIKADDVKCTHGATVGRLSNDELFYLQSRAIPYDLARHLLIRGFAHDVLQAIHNKSLSARFEQVLNRDLFLEAA